MGAIIICVFGFRGHAAPLMALSAELIRRGHSVTFVTPSASDLYQPDSSLWEADAHPQMEFVHPFDQYEIANGFYEARKHMEWQLKVGAKGPLMMLQDMVESAASMYEPMFVSIQATLKRGGRNGMSFDLMICDYVTAAGIDNATHHEIPLIINAPGLKMPFHSSSFVSMLLLDYTLPLSKPRERFLNHFMVNYIFRISAQSKAMIMLFYPTLSKAARKLLGKPIPDSMLVDHQLRHPVLFNTALGVSEIAQYQSPLEHFVGALLPLSSCGGAKEEKANDPAGATTEAALDPELAHWLEDVVPPQKPVVFINFGTSGNLTPTQFQTLVRSFAEMPELQRPYILWRLSLAQQESLGVSAVHSGSKNNQQTLPPYIRVTTWIRPTQRAVLCHPRITLFLTHGGINSPQEAIQCGKPLIVVPCLFDQGAHAARLEYTGVAVRLKSSTFTTADVHAAYDKLMAELPVYKGRVAKAQRVLANAGGTFKAANIVEEYLRLGYNHLVPADMQLPFWKRVMLLDVIFCYAVMIVSVLWALKCVLSIDETIALLCKSLGF